MSLSAGSGLTSFITVGTEEDGDTGALAVLTRHNSSSSRYLIVQLQNDPDNTDNLTVVYKKKVSPLVSDDDTPMIPVSEALVESTIATMRRYDEQYTQAREHDRESNKFLSSLVAEEDGQAVKRSQARPAAGRMRNRARMRGF